MIRGDFVKAQRAKCVLYSVIVIPSPAETPISSMSGSFQLPGPALIVGPLLRILDFTDPNESLISPVVLQLFPVTFPQESTFSSPQLHIEKKIGLEVAFSASLIVAYLVGAGVES